MRVYIIKDSDFDDLTAAIDRDPQWGERGGSSQILNPEEREAHERAHRFFNYQIRVWIDAMKRGDRG
jgi:hypothetical protein